ncbi:MAG: ATP-binding protein [Deltaproteobacteria bacterium]|nr:ATP-binding protein [Deltaproteobacteria bacterium]MBN2672105.1 ATP-binding protein [Deltaproteobacteria bacterium]
MIIAVASGKGGAGKTFVATHLATALAREGKQVVYVDADVEEPNGHLFLHPDITEQKSSKRLVPFLPSGNCIGCGNCQTVCAFHAILVLGKQVTVFDDLCHGCGACLLACEHNYLSEKHVPIGDIQQGKTNSLSFVGGTLNVGEPRSTPLITDVVQTALASRKTNADEYVIIDAPPGTSCSAVAATEAADLVILVAEPTRLGFHDFQLAFEMATVIHKEVAVVINRADLGTEELRKFVHEKKLPLLLEIPFNDVVARMGTEGNLAIDEDATVAEQFSALSEQIIHRTEVSGGRQ